MLPGLDLAILMPGFGHLIPGSYVPLGRVPPRKLLYHINKYVYVYNVVRLSIYMHICKF